MIKVDGINLTLKGREILSDINLELLPGNIYGLVGNNGSGKTMLMKVICGLVKPGSGTVTCDGRVIGRDDDYLPDAGVIIETPGFISYYSGIRNLKLLAASCLMVLPCCSLQTDYSDTVKYYPQMFPEKSNGLVGTLINGNLFNQLTLL